MVSRVPYTLLVAAVLLAGGCGSTSPTTQKTVSQPVRNTVPEKVDEQPLTANQMIEEAQMVWQTIADKTLRNDYLLQAAEMMLAAQDTEQTRQIVYTLRNEMTTRNHQVRLNLLLAQLYKNDPKVGSSQRLALLEPAAFEPELKQLQNKLKANEYARLGQWLAAANALLMSDEQNPEYVNQAWEWVNRASDESLADSAKFNKLSAYVSLKQLILENGFNPTQLKEQIARYQKVFRGHPLVMHWPENLRQIDTLTTTSRDKIVVLLPLSGRLQVTGRTIKEGILAAYFDDSSAMNATIIPEIQFIDTNTTSIDDIVEKVAPSDWIIGPLLKENVDALLPKLSANNRILTLNRPENLNTSVLMPAQPTELLPASFNTQIYYALAPEDEAKQLAQQVFSRGRRAPILVASENTLHQRQQEAFLAQWEKLTAGLAANQHSQPTLVTYTDNSTLRDGILDALDVAQSKARIREIQGFADVEVYNLPRNRRDIDAIVVFTTPEQTELVNPVIEASISPFGGVSVPVFATSRSIDYSQSRNQWRDLENLHFLDMPWVLPGNPSAELAAQTQQLWPQRPTPLERLFAFGVDAYHLIPRLSSMQALPQLTFEGLTGTLSVNRDREIVRVLPEAVVSQESIQVLAQ